MSRSDILALCSDWPTASAAAVCARLRELGIWAPCRPIRSADAVRVVRRRGCRAGRRVNTFRLSRPLSAAPRPSSEPGNTVPLSRPSCFDITATVTTTDCGNHVHFGCLNICSWNNKFDDVVELISDLDLSVLCLTETWLDEDSPVVNRCRSSGFSVIDQPRSRSRDDLSVNHGGVAIVGAPGLSLSPLPLGPPLSSFEASACIVSSGRCRVAVAVLYRPGSHAVKSAIFDDLAAFLERLAVLSSPIFIAGISTFV